MKIESIVKFLERKGQSIFEQNFAKLNFLNSKTRGGAEVSIKWDNKDLFNL